MKNIKDRINSQLFKVQEVELSAEKVELSSVKELQSSLKAIYKEQRVLDKKMPQLEKLQKEVNETKDNLKYRNDEAEKALKNFESSAKELGLDPQSSGDYKQLKIEVSNNESEYLK